MGPMRRAEAFREAVVSRLRDVVERRGETVTSIERALGRGRGYLADALRGDKRLSLEVLLETLDLLDVAPGSFFAAVSGRYPVREPGGEGEVAEGPAAEGSPAYSPYVRLARRLDLLVDALEERGAVDARTAARLRAPSSD